MEGKEDWDLKVVELTDSNGSSCGNGGVVRLEPKGSGGTHR